MKLRSLEDIVNADLCLGCGICQAIAGDNQVKIELDSEGFFRPKVLQDTSNSWDLIKQVCPGILVQHQINSTDRSWDPLWGPIIDLKAGYATDETIRWQASSGGAISALLCYLLESESADYVLQIGASLEKPLDNKIYLSRSREDILKCAGSRYAPAAPLTQIRTLLQQNVGRVVFVGKPCDVAALRAFLKFHPELTSKITCLISFFCAGTPSIHATEDVIQAMGANKSKVVNFRYRGNGWPGQAMVVTSDGESYQMGYDDSWGKILGRQLQFRCKICPDGVGELADITCADGWYLKEGSPDFTEKPGRSLIFSRTELGRKIVAGAIESGYLASEPYNLSEVELIQPYQAKRRRLVASRLLALLIAQSPSPKYVGFHLIRNALRISMKDNWGSFTGMLHRLEHRPHRRSGLIFKVLKTLSYLRHTFIRRFFPIL